MPPERGPPGTSPCGAGRNYKACGHASGPPFIETCLHYDGTWFVISPKSSAGFNSLQPGGIVGHEGLAFQPRTRLPRTAENCPPESVSLLSRPATPSLHILFRDDVNISK